MQAVSSCFGVIFLDWIVLADDDSFRLSRKDALKRHVYQTHVRYRQLLKNVDLKILVPRRKNVPEDLRQLKRAMFPKT